MLEIGLAAAAFDVAAQRLQEAGRLELTEIPGEPWASFTQRFVEAERRAPWDLVWLSHVFFDSGFVVQDLDAIAEAAPAQALVAFDGYHAFCALPVDLSRTHHRAFYLAGGYKYAMSGEGACFLAVPPGCAMRPANTGWFASFETLPHGSAAAVPYAGDGFRFWGSTFDASGLYRFNAAMENLQSLQLTIADVHRHALGLQKHFIDGLARLALRELPAASRVPPAGVRRGNFLAFDVDSAEDVHRRIAAQDVTIDRRDRRLRFGFGIYQDPAQVARLLERLGSVLQ
jgi:selenocysteine lyase/cysteine desulfurase